MRDHLIYVCLPSISISKPGFNKSSTSGGSFFLPNGNGASESEEIIDSMDDEKLMSISAMPSYENISLEELRWQDYQDKKIDSTLVCKFCNKAGSLIPVSSSPSSSKSPNITPNNPILSSAYDFNSKAFVLGSPSLPLFASLESSGKDGINTLSGPIQPNNISALHWPQNPLQLSISSIPGPIMTIQPSPPMPAVEQNIPGQMPLEQTTMEKSLSVPSGIFSFSDTMYSSARVGISSLPDNGKSSQTRSISLLAGKHVFQKTVIRMQTRRHGSRKQDGPRVSFLHDYMD